MITTSNFPVRMRLLLCAVLLCFCGNADAAVALKVLARGLSAPVFVTPPRDGSSRLFIVEQGGKIRIFDNGAILGTPFLDITSRVLSGGELGLLGLAFHPNYRVNGRFFVNYTRNGANGIETVVAEYSAAPANSNFSSPSSEKILFTFPQPFTNHKGGMLAFGPDGFLYIATGDGGSGGDPFGNGQNLNVLLGKILRIDVDSAPYGIPSDNPFAGTQARGEIWAYGLRNPWRFSFDSATGRLFAGDVGQDLYEEVDIVVKGGNYGWNIMEGSHCYSPPVNCNRSGITLPIYDYGRDTGSTVIGGYVYRGTAIPPLVGKYVFGDFGSQQIWSLTALPSGQWVKETLISSGPPMSSFGEDVNGELYLVDYSGVLSQLVVSDASQPTIADGGLVNAASYLAGPVAPGEIVSIFGSGLGPDQAAGGHLNSAGFLDSAVAGTRVLFDGVAAPLFYVQANQINAQVPYEVAGNASTVMQVEFGGVLSAPVTVPVAASTPAIFAAAGAGGQAAMLNHDLTPNAPSNPAARGSIAVLYATGEGQISPSGVDGRLSMFPFPAPVLDVSVTIAGLPADVIFSGSAPGYTGLLQVNVHIPAAVAPGSQIPVLLKVGTQTSPPGLTMAVN